METSSGVDAHRIREEVRERYSRSARRVAEGRACCNSTQASATCCGQGPGADPVSVDLYSGSEVADLPVEALLASLGCGNPTALAGLRPGEVVLDLGSGGGVDVLLAAKRVGPQGFVYGLDMTDEMLALAEENRKKAGVHNARFLKGYIEAIPLPDNSIDAIISNCVINLSADKPAVLREAFRVLKPGGRLAVSDIVMLGDAPEALVRTMEDWTGCIAGALRDTVYLELLKEAGFENPEIQVTRRYSPTALDCCGEGLPQETSELAQADGLFASAFIRANKPGLAIA